MSVVEQPVHAEPAGAVALARLFRVLGDETRVRILERLAEGPATVVGLVAALGAPPRSRVSNHLACLAHCGFVTRRRAGKHVIYSLAELDVTDLLAQARRLAEPHVELLSTCNRIGPDWA